MVNADKILLIQDLQCKLTNWLTKFNSSIGLNQCPEKFHSVNVQVNNLINVMYRYSAFTTEVTNADKVSISLVDVSTPETYLLTINYGATILVSEEITNPNTLLLSEICALINLGTDTHTYKCSVVDGALYIYSYDVGVSFADLLNVTATEDATETTKVTATVEKLGVSDLTPLLDSFNCITTDELCSVIAKIKELLGNCNCK